MFVSRKELVFERKGTMSLQEFVNLIAAFQARGIVFTVGGAEFVLWGDYNASLPELLPAPTRMSGDPEHLFKAVKPKSFYRDSAGKSLFLWSFRLNDGKEAVLVVMMTVDMNVVFAWMSDSRKEAEDAGVHFITVFNDLVDRTAAMFGNKSGELK